MISQAAATDIPIAHPITPPKLAVNRKSCEIAMITCFEIFTHYYTQHVNNGVVLVSDITNHCVFFPEELNHCTCISNTFV